MAAKGIPEKIWPAAEWVRRPGDKRHRKDQGAEYLLGFQQSQASETEGKDLPSVEQDQIREHLKGIDRHKSEGPDGMHPHVWKELANVTTRSLSIIFQVSW